VLSIFYLLFGFQVHPFSLLTIAVCKCCKPLKIFSFSYVAILVLLLIQTILGLPNPFISKF